MIDGLHVPAWVLSLRGVKLGERMVLAVLVGLGESGTVSCAELAERLGIGERTARRHLEDLDASGLITLRRAGPQGYTYGLKAGHENGRSGRYPEPESGHSGRYQEPKAAILADLNTGQNGHSSAQEAANLADIPPNTGQVDRYPPHSPPRDLDQDLISEGGAGGGPEAAAARIEAEHEGAPWPALRAIVAPPTAVAWLRLLEELAAYPPEAVADACRRFVAKFEGAMQPAQPGRYLAAMVRNAAKAWHAEQARKAEKARRERSKAAEERERERAAERAAVPPPPEARSLAELARTSRSSRARELSAQAEELRARVERERRGVGT